MRVELTESATYESIEDTERSIQAEKIIDDALHQAFKLRDRLATDIYIRASRCVPFALLFQSAADVAKMYPNNDVTVDIEIEKDIRRRMWVLTIVLNIATGKFRYERHEVPAPDGANTFVRHFQVTTHYDTTRLPNEGQAVVEPAKPAKRRMNFRPKAGLKLISNDPPVKVGE